MRLTILRFDLQRHCVVARLSAQYAGLRLPAVLFVCHFQVEHLSEQEQGQGIAC